MKDKEENEEWSSLLENFIKLSSKWRLGTKYKVFVGSRNSKKWGFAEDEEEKDNER